METGPTPRDGGPGTAGDGYCGRLWRRHPARPAGRTMLGGMMAGPAYGAGYGTGTETSAD
ncbi:hypothetical protein GCM10020221_27710 [Streptomyces thioluteus]|uniref:Uncharacterized protein n=1 Tax=Streptomyces thioluteus TaxID=66431 RepID=A0ABN3WYD9_STRTU